MCFTKYKLSDYIPRIALRDIVRYKCVDVGTNIGSKDKEEVYISPILNSPIRFNKVTYGKSHERFSFIKSLFREKIDGGYIHLYNKSYSCSFVPHCYRYEIKAIIPRGTIYFSNRDEAIARKVIYQDGYIMNLWERVEKRIGRCFRCSHYVDNFDSKVICCKKNRMYLKLSSEGDSCPDYKYSGNPIVNFSKEDG